MFKRVVLLGLLVVGVSACSTAPKTVVSNNDASDKVATVDKNDKVICRNVKSVGSNFSKRVCYTRQDIERNQDAMRRMQKTGATSNTESRQ